MNRQRIAEKLSHIKIKFSHLLLFFMALYTTLIMFIVYLIVLGAMDRIVICSGMPDKQHHSDATQEPRK